MSHIRSFFNASPPPPLFHGWLWKSKYESWNWLQKHSSLQRGGSVFHHSIFSVWTIPPIPLGECCKFIINLQSIHGEKKEDRQTSYFMEANGRTRDFETAWNSTWDVRAALLKFIVEAWTSHLPICTMRWNYVCKAPCVLPALTSAPLLGALF